MRLLILNSNTSTWVTARPVAHAQALLAARMPSASLPQVTLDSVTASLGASYIASEASFAIAGHAALGTPGPAMPQPAARPTRSCWAALATLASGPCAKPPACR